MTASNRSAPPTISVCIPTARGWGPELREVCDGLADQTAAVGGELYILDGSGRPAPPHGAFASVVRWHQVPRMSVVELRAEVLRLAEGEIVVITEDHCRVTPDWCATHLQVHAEHPDADVVTGTVDNDSTDKALDWAAFYLGYGPDLPPIPPAPPGKARASMINASYKRRAMGRDDASLYVVGDERLQVWHRESYGVGGTTAVNFHSGRTVEGLRSREHPDARAARAIRALALPVPRVSRRLLTAYRRGQPIGRVARSVPWMLWLAWAQSFGEALGALGGPGSSPRKVR